MASTTRRCSSLETGALPVSTRDTVLMETRARSATSRTVTRDMSACQPARGGTSLRRRPSCPVRLTLPETCVPTAPPQHGRCSDRVRPPAGDGVQKMPRGEGKRLKIYLKSFSQHKQKNSDSCRSTDFDTHRPVPFSDDLDAAASREAPQPAPQYGPRMCWCTSSR